MKKQAELLKTFNMRMSKDMWLFLKQAAAQQETSMGEIIIRCVNKYQKKFEEKNENKLHG